MCSQWSLVVAVIIASFYKEVPPPASATKLETVQCGIDNSPDVIVGNVTITDYPWLGILYYSINDRSGENRAVTTVALIHREFVVGVAADIGPMPVRNFKKYARVLLGENWTYNGRRVSKYILHPEYDQTMNTLAIVQLKDPVRTVHYSSIFPLCPPPEILRDPEFYVMKFDSNYNDLQKQVVPVSHVPGRMCKDFYVSANLYAEKLRPPRVSCVLALEMDKICVWEAGATLVARDVWGRWQLLGLGVRGPGCSAPSRFLDMMSYYPWLEDNLEKYRRLSITRLNKHSYVLRSTDEARTLVRYGACDPDEKENLIYRDGIYLRTDNFDFQFLTYNITLYESIEYSCLTFDLINATSKNEMTIEHSCTRETFGPACYAYRGSMFDLAVYVMFMDTCLFEMSIWGRYLNMTPLDIQEWKWEEGSYYADFTLARVEYRGSPDITNYGFEPLDDHIWLPEFDLWTTTQFDNSTWSSTTPTPSKGDGFERPAGHMRPITNIVGNPFLNVPHPGDSDNDTEFSFGIDWLK